MPHVRPIPLVILLYPPGPLTFFLYGRLGYRFWFLICCINFPTCLVLLDSFLQLRYFFWFLYGTLHPYVPDSFISVRTSHRNNSISRLLPTFDYMEWFRRVVYLHSFVLSLLDQSSAVVRNIFLHAASHFDPGLKLCSRWRWSIRVSSSRTALRYAYIFRLLLQLALVSVNSA
jgi:hypothetical protein